MCHSCAIAFSKNYDTKSENANALRLQRRQSFGGSMRGA